jgi:polar amino acid transport system permease protein
MYHFDWEIFWKYLNPATALIDPLIRNGLIVTIVVSILAQLLGVILGLFAALGKTSKFMPFKFLMNTFGDALIKNRLAYALLESVAGFTPLKVLADVYVWYFRGTPLLVQMSLLFFGLGVTHIYDFPDLDLGFFIITGAIQAGLLALGINEGAYMAEIVRAGIEAVDPGQLEAAKSLGMTYGTAMRRIVLPQAAKVIIPPLGNEFNNMMKTTSIMQVISAAELFFGFTQVNARLFKPFELFIAASFYYLMLTTIWDFFQRMIESSLGERKVAEQAGFFQRVFGSAPRPHVGGH